MARRLITTFTPTRTRTRPACLHDGFGLPAYRLRKLEISASWAVPSTADSGIYIAQLVRDDTGGASDVIFVVRNDASTSAMLFQTSTKAGKPTATMVGSASTETPAGSLLPTVVTR